jgi:hypothetical protein
MGFKCHASLNGWFLNGHVSLNDWFENGHVSLKKSFNYTCSCICNLLYEYEWMKSTNILYVHRMYNMSHATRCHM